jgi:hypothetical protein
MFIEAARTQDREPSQGRYVSSVAFTIGGAAHML